MEDLYILLEDAGGWVRQGILLGATARPGETRAAWQARALDKLRRAEGSGATVLLEAVMPDGLPLGRGKAHPFPDAWRHVGGGRIEIDLSAARKIKLAEIRAERDSRFPPLDNEWMKAQGQGDAALAAQIEARRQALRDLPQTIDLDALKEAETLASFAPIWP